MHRPPDFNEPSFWAIIRTPKITPNREMTIADIDAYIFSNKDIDEILKGE